MDPGRRKILTADDNGRRIDHESLVVDVGESADVVGQIDANAVLGLILHLLSPFSRVSCANEESDVLFGSDLVLDGLEKLLVRGAVAFRCFDILQLDTNRLSRGFDQVDDVRDILSAFTVPRQLVRRQQRRDVERDPSLAVNVPQGDVSSMAGCP